MAGHAGWRLEKHPNQVLLKDAAEVAEEVSQSEQSQLLALQELDKLERQASYKWARCLGHTLQTAGIAP